ncbi:hypothetical protein [Simkania sp.]|uniref:hypothetical protein n=1 Tax=Simkania sp. TaxID=34094 RepID=UPI003B52630A
MTAKTYGLNTDQVAYNQAINEYLDRPSESTLNNLKVTHLESGIEDSSLINDIAKRHFAETKVTETSSFKKREVAVQAEMETTVVDVTPTGNCTGLKNLKNTCWGNSTLQAFVLSNPDIDRLLNIPLDKKESESGEEFQARKDFQASLKALKDEYTKETPDQTRITTLLTQVWTSDVLKSSSLRPMDRQEDAPEFLGLILETLDADKHEQISFEKRSKLVKPSETTHETGGTNQIMIMPIEHTANPTLQTSINGIFKEEDIDGVDDEKLGRKVTAQKNMYYSSNGSETPTSLTVQLLRFQYDGIGTKIKTEVKGFDQPIRVPFHDDKGTLVKHGVYQVDSVVIHLGNTLRSGHYLTLVRTGPDSWEERNDSFVRPVSSEEAHKMMQENGYLVRMTRVREEAAG